MDLIQSEKRNGILFARIMYCDFTMYFVPGISHALKVRIDAETTSLLIDMKNVSTMDSYACASLVKMSKFFKARDGILGLVGLLPQAREILQMLMLEPWLPLFSDMRSGVLAAESRKQSLPRNFLLS